mmetsp:Transcript_27354/g.44453  ORF Transcript_27354/g.44453 Transcript_27354/m.44453 type:complete len:575 (+) Transcript_27354:53-1777(+)
MRYIEKINALENLFTGDGGVQLSRERISQILKESNYNVDEAAMRIMLGDYGAAANGATVNEGDVIANNNGDVPDEAITNADDDAAINEAAVDDADTSGIAHANDTPMCGEGEDHQGMAKKSRIGTPQKPPQPESERDAVARLGPFSTPVKADEGEIVDLTLSMGSGREIVDLTHSLGSAQLKASTAVNDEPSEEVTLRRVDEEEDSKMPARATEAEDEEIDDSGVEDPSSGPSDLPLGAILIQPPQAFVPEDGDISMFHGRKKQDTANYTEFVRVRVGRFVQLVSSRRRNSDGGLPLEQIFKKCSEESLLHEVGGERLAGINFCRDEMVSLTGRFYFTSKNGLSYELDRTERSVQMRLYISLCRCKVDGVEQHDMESMSIEAYIATIVNDDEPSIDATAYYGVTRVVNEEKSKAQAKRYRNEKGKGLTPAVDAWNSEEVILGDRFIDELHDLAENAEKDFISFTTPKKIVQALGGDHSHLVDSDVAKYRGCIITDPQKLADEMNFEGHAQVLRDMKKYFKTASCNPKLLNRGLKSGDVFIFHHENFYGGEAGKDALKDVHVKYTWKYENGKKRE